MTTAVAAAAVPPPPLNDIVGNTVSVFALGSVYPVPLLVIAILVTAPPLTVAVPVAVVP